MKSINETMKVVFEKCTLLLDGVAFSKEDIMKAFSVFLSSTAEKENHNAALMLHTGSEAFDAIAIAYAAVSNMILNETDPDDVVTALTPGDYVYYGLMDKKTKTTKKICYRFDGMVDCDGKPSSNYVRLVEKKGDVTYVPRKQWGNIMPLNEDEDNKKQHNAFTIKDKRSRFFCEVLGVNQSEIPNVIDTSTIIVMYRNKADEIVPKLSFRFNIGKEEITVSLLELITASYFSQNDEDRYPGNKSKAEPVLKFVNHFDTARILLKNHDGNRNIGIIILGDEMISRGWTELPQLIDKKSLQYVFISAGIDTRFAETLLKDHEDLQLFACTKRFLSGLNHTKRRSYPKYLQDVMHRVDNILNFETVENQLVGPLTVKDYYSFRNAVMTIRQAEYEDENKDEFIKQASLLKNLYQSAVFTMKELENAIDDGAVLEIKKPSEKLVLLRDIRKSLPSYLQEPSERMLNILQSMHDALWEQCEKKNELIRQLEKNQDIYTAVVVPKDYYIAVMRHAGIYGFTEDDPARAMTPARFDHDSIYEEVIMVADLYPGRFNPFRCLETARVRTLLYNSEKRYYRYKLWLTAQTEILYDQRALHIPVKDLSAAVTTPLEMPTEEDIAEENNFEEYLHQLSEKISFTGVGIGSGVSGHSSGTTTEVVAAAVFEDHQKAFFSRYYKPLVFDESKGSVVERSPQDLHEGDAIIFTKSGDETRDVVTTVIEKLMDSGKGNEMTENFSLHYKLSLLWKKSLRAYQKKHEFSDTEMATLLQDYGARVQEMTIQYWLDPDCNTVGPRNIESLEAIVKLLNLPGTPTNYYEACGIIRKVRVDIQRHIGEALVDKLNGKEPEPGTLLADVYDRIGTLADVRHIQAIHVFEESQQIPGSMTNRPIAD